MDMTILYCFFLCTVYMVYGTCGSIVLFLLLLATNSAFFRTICLCLCVNCVSSRILKLNMFLCKRYIHYVLKKQDIRLLMITLANEHRFSKFFNWQISKQILYVYTKF